MKTICAWCAKVILDGKPGSLTSHGICTSCITKFMEGDRSPK